MLEILDLLFFDAEVEDKSVRGLENQSLLLAAPFLTSTQKREGGVVRLNLWNKQIRLNQIVSALLIVRSSLRSKR